MLGKMKVRRINAIARISAGIKEVSENRAERKDFILTQMQDAVRDPK